MGAESRQILRAPQGENTSAVSSDEETRDPPKISRLRMLLLSLLQHACMDPYLPEHVLLQEALSLPSPKA